MRIRSAAVMVTSALLLAACGNAKTSASSGGSADTQGITANSVQVGGLAAITGPLGSQFVGVFDGAQAYFEMINAQGGVNGRQIKYTPKLDDATNGSRNAAQARNLNEQYKVFAVVGVASPIFTGGTYLGANNVPTFGFNINPEWEGPPSLFGEKGSALDFFSPGPGLPYIVKKLGLNNVGVLAYNVTQSADCADQTVRSYKKYGFNVVFQDKSLPFGTSDISSEVERMKQAHLEFISTCLDDTGNTLLSRSLRQAGLGKVVQYWPNGYNQRTLSKFADLMEGVYVYSNFTPFEASGASPGTQQYLATMAKYAPAADISEVSQAGWINAELFVAGLRAAGKNPTRTKLINAINAMTHFTADGIFPDQAPRDWRYDHHHTPHSPYPDCQAYIQVQQGKFVPIYGTGSSSFFCIDHFAATLPS